MGRISRYNLAEVRRLAHEKEVWFSARSRSTRPVIKVYEHTASAKSEAEAEEFILLGIAALAESDFVESVFQWNDPECIADVYGFWFDGRPWYVKFRIDEDGQLDEISFHPPEREIETRDGRVIPTGERSNGEQE